MMLKFSLKSIILLGLLITFFTGCGDKEKPKIHWDRDMCERCKMVISERKFAVQVTNPKNKKSFVFDDLGCAIVWFEQEKKDWFDSAVILVNDFKTGNWIDARKAIYTVGNLTPMGYGLSAYTEKTFPNNGTKLSFQNAIKVIDSINHEHKRERGYTEIGKNHE